MTVASEKSVQDRAKRRIKARGCYLLTTSSPRPHSGRAGLLDLNVSAYGYWVSFEMKRPGNRRKATALQQLTIDNIRASGGMAYVADDPEMVELVLETLAEADVLGLNPAQARAKVDAALAAEGW